MSEGKKGRPPGRNENTVSVMCRLTPELKALLATAAAKEDRSLGAHVRAIVRKELMKDE